METPESRIRRARTQLVLNQPFFASLMMHCETKPNPFVAKCAIDGETLWYNPEYVMAITQGQVQSDLAACVTSVALLHHTRKQDHWDPTLGNMASDAIVNPIIKGAGFELSPNAFVDSDITIGTTLEEAYSILVKKYPPPPGGNDGDGDGQGQGDGERESDSEGDGQGQGKSASGKGGKSKKKQGKKPPVEGGGSSEVMPPPSNTCDGSEAGKSQQERKWNQAATQAAETARGCGTIPEGMDRLIDMNKQSKTDWRTILQRFFSELTPKDYRWFPPNKRYIAAGKFLPSMFKEGFGEIVIAVDTSGSIDVELLSQFGAEINALLSDLRPDKVTVIYCDSAIGRVETYSEGEPLRLRAVGGGGTDFVPPFKYVDKHGIVPRCMIYFTDLCCDSYPKEPAFPVLWAVDNKHSSPPWGETIFLPVSAD